MAMKLRDIQFRVDVVMIEYILDAERLEQESDEKDQIGWIATLDDMKPALEENSDA